MKVNKIVFIICIVIIYGINLKAQQVVATSGSFLENANGSISFTIGEPVIATFQTDNIIVTQGFQQPNTFHYIHLLNLPSGWSGISSYVSPSQKAMEAVFDPIISDLIIVQDMEGMYYPAMNTNTIGNWNSHAAFKVKTGAAVALPVTGQKETNFVVELEAGWGLLPVVSHCPVDIAGLFAPVVSNLTIVKDIAGIGVYWPAMNINTIGELLPGKAYFVKMSNSGNVVFPACSKSGSSSGVLNLTGLQDLSGFGIAQTPSTHTIAILPEALKGFEQGTIIGAFDQTGNCFGATVFNSENISLTVFGDDPTTAEKDGFFEGEMIFFKNLSGLQDLTGLEPMFDPQLPSADGLFTVNGLSAIRGFEATAGIALQVFSPSVQLFPNPTSGIVNISGISEGADVVVTDLRGQVVFGDEQFSTETAGIDLSHLPAGVYLVKITQRETPAFRKLILQ
jgi:hypothetical protein